jgi:hypothetical protein
MDPAMEKAGQRSLTTGHGNLILACNSFAEKNLRISHWESATWRAIRVPTA